MKRKDILNALFWILLVIGIILVLWRIFGNSPSDLEIILTFILMLMFKLFALGGELKDFKHEVRFSFYKVKKDMGNIKNKIETIEK